MSQFLRPEQRIVIPRAFGAPSTKGFPNVPLPGAGPQKLKTAAFLTYTYSDQDPDDPSGIESSSMLKGYNADVVLDVVRDKLATLALDGNVNDDGTSVSFEGWAALIFLSLFDVAIMGEHLQPLSHVEAIRSLAAPRQIEIIQGFVNLESINQAAPHNALWEPLRDLSKANWLPADPTSGPGGDGENAYGCTAIDYFEDLPWTIATTNDAIGCPPVDASHPSTKHSWVVDVGASGYAAGWAATLAGILEARYIDAFAAMQLDGVLCDNGLTGPLRTSAATNGFPASYTDERYHDGFVEALDAVRVSLPSSWVNTADHLDFWSASEFPHRFVEHWFRKFSGSFVKRTLGELQASIAAMRSAGVRIMPGGLSGPGSVTGWFTGPGPGGVYGTWADLAEKVAEVDGFGHFVVQSARATSGGWLYWQPEFRHPGE